MNRTIDVKSFLIGFLLALVMALLMGSGSSSGVMNVKIVGFSGNDSIPVTLKDSTMKMEIVDVRYGVELPVVIKK